MRYGPTFRRFVKCKKCGQLYHSPCARNKAQVCAVPLCGGSDFEPIELGPPPPLIVRNRSPRPPGNGPRNSSADRPLGISIGDVYLRNQESQQVMVCNNSLQPVELLDDPGVFWLATEWELTSREEYTDGPLYLQPGDRTWLWVRTHFARPIQAEWLLPITDSKGVLVECRQSREAIHLVWLQTMVPLLLHAKSMWDLEWEYRSLVKAWGTLSLMGAIALSFSPGAIRNYLPLLRPGADPRTEAGAFLNRTNTQCAATLAMIGLLWVVVTLAGAAVFYILQREFQLLDLWTWIPAWIRFIAYVGWLVGLFYWGIVGWVKQFGIDLRKPLQDFRREIVTRMIHSQFTVPKTVHKS